MAPAARLVVVALLATVSLGVAPPVPDSPAMPLPYVVSSEHFGTFMFRMTPKDYATEGSEPYGQAFRVGRTAAEDELLWEVRGWYAFSTFLSMDGRYLVRLGNWPSGHEPEEADLAVAFYEDGRLLAEHSTLDVIRDVSKVQPSVSHYGFLDAEERPGLVPLSRHDYKTSGFTLTSVDRVRWTFDIRTGEVVDSVQLPDAGR